MRPKPAISRRILHRAGQPVCESLEPRQLLSTIPLPVIPNNTFVVTSYGAQGNGTTDNTTSIQNAINAAGSAGGGTVEVPAGTFLSGPITLSTKINLQIDSGGILQALPHGTYPDVGNSPKNFITISSKNNVEISGSGTIDGNGAAWWTAYNADNSVNRPRLINITSSDTVWVRNVTLQNSPMFHLATGNTNNMTIDSIHISASSTSPNTDGMDLAGLHYLVENCTTDTGDDNIVMKPGTSFCSDITITGCTFLHGHGLSIGGQTNLGLDGMTVTNCTFNGTVSGLRMKASRAAGGLVQNVTYSNITMTNVQYPININSYYDVGTIPTNPQDPAQAVTSTTPIWKNITISNLTSTNSASSTYCGIIWGLPEEPVMNVSLVNVKLSASLGMDINHVRNVSFDSQCTLTAASGGDEISTKTAGTPYDAVVVAGGWSDQDINSPGVVGTTMFDPDTGKWIVTGGGADIGGAADQFNFPSAGLTGDGSIIAQVTSQTGTDAAARAGVMIRADNTAGAAFAAVEVTHSNGLMFQWRASAGAAASSVSVAGLATPMWVQLSRWGNVISAYYSSDNSHWTQIGGAQAIAMNSAVLAGLAVTPHNNSTTNAASFSSVAVNGQPVIAEETGSTLNVNLAAATGAVTLGTSGANTTVTSGATYSFSAVVSVTVAFSAAADVLNFNSGPAGPISLLNSLASDTVNVNSGTATFAAPAAGAGLTAETLDTLLIAAGAKAVFADPVSHADRAVVVLNALTIRSATGIQTGLLDLAGNDLVVKGGDWNSIANDLNSGINLAAGGYWNGAGGIISSAAANDSTHLTTLGAIQNDDGTGHAIYGSSTTYGPFDNQDVGTADVLVKYTYYGDADLSGKVDGTDYGKIDNGFTHPALTGWFNGDFNYDGAVDGSDYSLIDNAFNMQAASLASSAATFALVSPAPAKAVAVAMTQSAGRPAILVMNNTSVSAAVGFGGAPMGSSSIDDILTEAHPASCELLEQTIVLAKRKRLAEKRSMPISGSGSV